MTMILTAVAGATAGAAAWLIAPWASMAVHGTVEEREWAGQQWAGRP